MFTTYEVKIHTKRPSSVIIDEELACKIIGSLNEFNRKYKLWSVSNSKAILSFPSGQEINYHYTQLHYNSRSNQNCPNHSNFNKVVSLNVNYKKVPLRKLDNRKVIKINTYNNLKKVNMEDKEIKNYNCNKYFNCNNCAYDDKNNIDNNFNGLNLNSNLNYIKDNNNKI